MGSGVGLLDFDNDGDLATAAAMIRVQFGLGDHALADRVRVTWPAGALIELRGVPAGRRLMLGF